MTSEDSRAACVCEIHKERFAYVRRGEQGEYIIPADMIERFVQTYLELTDSAAHLERLRLYRTGGRRDAPGDD